MQRSLAKIVRVVEAGALARRPQQKDGLVVAGGDVRGAVSHPVHSVQPCASGEQQLGDADVAVHGRPVQRRLESGRRPLVRDIGADAHLIDD